MSTTPGGEAPIGSRTDEIRGAAAHLFEQRGYSATTMAHIAAAVGIFPGSLYHHFESKEEIAVALLTALDQDLNRASSAVTRSADTPPEVRVRRLTAEVMALSFRNAAAVRLRAYEAPTVATEQLRRALQASAPALTRAWKAVIDDLAHSVEEPLGSDARLLRFALQTLALDAAIDYPPETDPRQLADHLCDLLLHGIAGIVPADPELDNSEAMAAARDAIGSWGPAPSTPGPDIRDRIVAAARLEFGRRGYEATTIRDIASTADVKMGTLYRHAESKDAILRQVIEPYTINFEKAIRAVLTTGSSEPASIDALAAVFVHGKRRFRAESEIVKMGWVDRIVPDNPLHGYYLATEERLELLRGVLGRGVAKGTLRPVGSATDVAPHIRYAMWLPYQDVARTGAARAHRFLRRSLLTGFLATPRDAR